MASSIGTIVDELGFVRAEMAALADREKFLKGQLIDAGPGPHVGELFDATVSCSERAHLDMKAVREKLTPQFIRAHTTHIPVTTVRIVGRVAARRLETV